MTFRRCLLMAFGVIMLMAGSVLGQQAQPLAAPSYPMVDTTIYSPNHLPCKNQCVAFDRSRINH